MSTPQEITHQYLQGLFGSNCSQILREQMIEYGLISDACSLRLRIAATPQENGTQILWEEETKNKDGRFALIFAKNPVNILAQDIDCIYPLLGQEIVLHQRKSSVFHGKKNIDLYRIMELSLR